MSNKSDFMEDIILVGFGGHAKSVLDSIERGGQYNIIGFTALERTMPYRGYKYLGKDNCLTEYFYQGVRNACVCVGYMGEGNIRDSIYNTLKNIGFHLPVIIDPAAVVSRDVSIGEGTFIGKNVIINADSKIGKMCIVNSGSLVEHEDVIGDFTHLAVGSVLCGNVTVLNHSFIGANSTIIQGIRVGNNSQVGAGAVVVGDIPDDCIAVGIPAKVIKYRRKL